MRLNRVDVTAMRAAAVVADVAFAGVGTARTTVTRLSNAPATTPEVVALGTVVALPAKARVRYWRRIGSGASL